MPHFCWNIALNWIFFGSTSLRIPKRLTLFCSLKWESAELLPNGFALTRYYERFPDKCFLFDSGDNIFPVVPGIYASLTKEWYRPDHTRTGFYLYLIENAFITYRPPSGKGKIPGFIRRFQHYPSCSPRNSSNLTAKISC